MQNLGLKPQFVKFSGNIKVLSIDNLLCRKFAAVCQMKFQIWNFLPVYFLIYDAAGHKVKSNIQNNLYDCTYALRV